MKGRKVVMSVGVAGLVAALSAHVAISAQDKYTLKVPGGLAFSEFRGFEDWQTVAVSQSGDKIDRRTDPPYTTVHEPGGVLPFSIACRPAAPPAARPAPRSTAPG